MNTSPIEKLPECAVCETTVPPTPFLLTHGKHSYHEYCVLSWWVESIRKNHPDRWNHCPSCNQLPPEEWKKTFLPPKLFSKKGYDAALKADSAGRYLISMMLSLCIQTDLNQLLHVIDAFPLKTLPSFRFSFSRLRELTIRRLVQLSSRASDEKQWILPLITPYLESPAPKLSPGDPNWEIADFLDAEKSDDMQKKSAKYRTAANSGIAYAYYELGKMTQQSARGEDLSLFEQGILGGCIEAVEERAIRIESTPVLFGLLANRRRAFMDYYATSTLSSPISLVKLTWYYHNRDRVIKRDPFFAFLLLSRAAIISEAARSAGDVKMINEELQKILICIDPADAEKKFQKLLEQGKEGDPSATYLACICYAKGIGTQKNPIRALELCRKSSNEGKFKEASLFLRTLEEQIKMKRNLTPYQIAVGSGAILSAVGAAFTAYLLDESDSQALVKTVAAGAVALSSYAVKKIFEYAQFSRSAKEILDAGKLKQNRL